MRRILSLLACFVIVAAAGENITPQEHNRFHNSNHRPTIRLQKERTMQELVRIDRSQARKIAREKCPDAGIEKIELRHRNRLIYWQVTTPACRLKIDAVSGSIIEKENRK
ncbi:PepSY domain-containing protein [Hydrogenimonas sp. SS33]|uniref:PepSY domain-containing protein n=1 Tax=Hydrogenimonas leucolamina TaxID=2954236 RepID=UPI00336BEE4D